MGEGQSSARQQIFFAGDYRSFEASPLHDIPLAGTGKARRDAIQRNLLRERLGDGGETFEDGTAGRDRKWRLTGLATLRISRPIDGGAAELLRRTKSFLRLLMGVADRLVCRDEEASSGFGAARLLFPRRSAV